MGDIGGTNARFAMADINELTIDNLAGGAGAWALTEISDGRPTLRLAMAAVSLAVGEEEGGRTMNHISARARRVSNQTIGRNRTQLPDFRVEYTTAVGWQIEIVSQRANKWAKENARSPRFNNAGGFIRTDLAGVNLLVHGARQDGLTSEYIGPRRIMRF